jgi:hypothetical protein
VLLLCEATVHANPVGTALQCNCIDVQPRQLKNTLSVISIEKHLKKKTARGENSFLGS